MTLTEFLEARIAEAEAGAADKHDRYDCDLHQLETYGDCSCTYPARVLAECVAKRRIVEESEEYEAGPTGRILASIYADHKDFQLEWLA